MKKAQAWGIDLMIAVIIFVFGATIFFLYTLNSDNSENNLEKLKYDGELIMNNILSSGSPLNWDSGNVIQIGIVDEGKINQTKLEKFYNLTDNDYARTKHLFNTKYDYFFFLSEDMTVNSQQIQGIGKPGINKDNIQAEDLIKVTRFTIYKDRPVQGYLYVWE